MTNNYQASFNSGELSRKMDGRTDLDVYRNGCRSLQNFYVMPQGGVERRTGTEFVDKTAYGWHTTGSIESSTFDSEVTITGNDGTGVFMKPDGTKLYTVVSTQNYLTEYDLSIAWDVSTAVQVNNEDLVAQFSPPISSSPFDLQISADGLSLWILDFSQKIIYEFTLTTAWDTSTIQAPANNSVDISATFSYLPQGFNISADGSYILLVQSTNVYKHELTTPFDVSTMGAKETLSIAANVSTATSIFARSDNKAFLVTDLTSDTVAFYSMDTFATSAFVDEFDISSKSSDPFDMYVDPTWAHMAVIDTTNDSVYLYDLAGFPRSGSGDTASRFIPFIFSSDVAYAMEFGVGYIKAWYVDGSGVNQSVDVTGAVPYTADDLRAIQYTPRFDTLILTHPDHPTQTLTRDTIAPTFSINETAFDLAPMLDENDTATLMQSDALTGAATITTTDDVFVAEHVGSTFKMRHTGNTSRTVAFGVTPSTPYSGDDWVDNGGAVNVSYSNWSVETSNLWYGQVWIQISYDGKATWEDYIQLADTILPLGEEKNFNFSSPSKESGNTWISIRYNIITNPGPLQVSYRNDDGYVTSTYKVDSVTSAQEVEATILSAVPATGVDTRYWSEGAFSDYRGYPATCEFHQDRLWFAGTEYEPATLYGSISGDYFNFTYGAEDDLAIRRVINSPETSKWLLSKRFLFLGTAGTAIATKSADNNSLITAGNIDTQSESVYGSAPIDAVIANDVILYVQKNGLKVREMVYFRDEEVFQSNDITILSEDISESGIVETFLQKQPDQNYWAIKANGDIGLLTYERGQEVMGWSRLETDGEYYSGCALPSENGEDQVWTCVKRLGKYLIERFHPRADLDWYVDSGVEYDGGDCVTADSIAIGASPDFEITITKATHLLSNGDIILLTNTNKYLDNTEYMVSAVTANTFVLQTISGVDINYYLSLKPDIPDFVDLVDPLIFPIPRRFNFSAFTSSLYATYAEVNEGFPPPENRTISYVGGWKIMDGSFNTEYTNPSTDSTTPPQTGWVSVATPTADVSVEYTDLPDNDPIPREEITVNIISDYCVVSNSIDGLDHLDGETVQVLVDGSYENDYVVASGTVSLEVYGNTILAGLKYESKLQPMPIEPVDKSGLSNSRKKGVAKVAIKILNSIGFKVGAPDKLQSNFASLKTSDLAGEPIQEITGEIRTFVGNNWERQKIIEIRQNLPYPLSVLGMSVWTRVEGA